MFCSQCGEALPHGIRQCPKCFATAPMIEEPAKNRYLYLTLALFLGNFGAHNFYAGYIGRGVIQLLLSCTVILAPLVSFWVLFEMFLVKSDSRHIPFSNRGRQFFLLGILVYLLLILWGVAYLFGTLMPALRMTLDYAETSRQLYKVNTLASYYYETFETLPPQPGKQGLRVLQEWSERTMTDSNRKLLNGIDWERYHYIGNNVAYDMFLSYEAPPIFLQMKRANQSGLVLMSLATGEIASASYEPATSYSEIVRNHFPDTTDWSAEPYRTLHQNALALKD